MVYFPKKCALCIHKDVTFQVREKFEEHVSNIHFPFLMEMINNFSFPIKCKKPNCGRIHYATKDIQWHIMNSSHSILKEFYYEGKQAIQKAKIKADPETVTDETISSIIEKCDFEKKFESRFEKLEQSETKTSDEVDKDSENGTEDLPSSSRIKIKPENQSEDVQDEIAEPTLDEQLLDACEKGLSYEEVMQLISNGGNYKIKNSIGWTVLHMASRNGHKALVQAFIELEPSLVQETTNLGQTALHLAAQGGHHDIVEILMKSTGTVDVKPNIQNLQSNLEQDDGDKTKDSETITEDSESVNNDEEDDDIEEIPDLTPPPNKRIKLEVNNEASEKTSEISVQPKSAQCDRCDIVFDNPSENHYLYKKLPLKNCSICDFKSCTTVGLESHSHIEEAHSLINKPAEKEKPKILKESMSKIAKDLEVKLHRIDDTAKDTPRSLIAKELRSSEPEVKTPSTKANGSLFQSLENIGTEIQNLSQENSELKSKNEALENDLKQQEHTEQRIAEVNKENESLKQDFAKLKLELDNVKALNTSLEKDCKAFETANNKLKKDVKDLEDKNSELKTELDSEKDNLANMVTSFTTEVDLLREENLRLTNENNDLNSKNVELKSDNDNYAGMITAMANDSDDLKLKNIQLSNEVKDLQDQKSKPEKTGKTGKAGKQNQDDLMRQNHDLAKEVEELKKAMAKMKVESEKDQSDLKMKSSLLSIENKALKEKLTVFESNLYQ